MVRRFKKLTKIERKTTIGDMDGIALVGGARHFKKSSIYSLKQSKTCVIEKTK
jgi:hypothetical protein